MLADRKNTLKFYQKIWRHTEGFKDEALSCKNKNSDLVTKIQSFLKLWTEQFLTLLNNYNCGCHRECEDLDTPIVDDRTVVPLPDQDEKGIAITRLKNDKAAARAGLLCEQFAYGGE